MRSSSESVVVCDLISWAQALSASMGLGGGGIETSAVALGESEDWKCVRRARVVDVRSRRARREAGFGGMVGWRKERSV